VKTEEHSLVPLSMSSCVFLTLKRAIFVELLGEVGLLGQAADVPLQHIPAHLVVKRVAEFGVHLRIKGGK
jgi:hypothetical protein